MTKPCVICDKPNGEEDHDCLFWLKSRIKELENPWIDVNDRMPNEGDEVIGIIDWDDDCLDLDPTPMILKKGVWIGLWYEPSEPFQIIGGDVTHWQPLPSPSKEKN